MARTDDSRPGSPASPDEVAVTEDLPGELLAEDLVEPEPYAVTAEESEAEELDETTIDDDDEQLAEATSVAAAARSSRPKRKPAEPTAPKGAPTPRKSAKATTVAEQRTTPVMFVNQSIDELKKVIWPTPVQVRQYFLVVLVFVLAVITFVSVLDLAFGWALLKLFG